MKESVLLKYLIVFIFSFQLLIFDKINAQNKYGNEWINYQAQLYYKFPVYTEGIYKIDYTALKNAGINIDVLDPRRLQVFHNGTEQFIYVEGESDGIFNSTDFVEFYGSKNDGALDSLLYDDPLSQPHTQYSLFTDTSYYFLTWNTSVANKRMKIETDINFTGYTPATYFIHPVFKYFTDQYTLGKPMESSTSTLGHISEYKNGQGWTSNFIEGSRSLTVNLANASVYSSGPDALVKIGVFGRSNDRSNNPDHKLTISFSTVNDIQEYEGYGLQRFEYTLPSSGISDNLSFYFIGSTAFSADWNLLSYISMDYPRTFSIGGATSMKMIIPDNTSKTKAYLEITNFNTSSTTGRIYDLTNHKRIDLTLSSGIYKVLVPNSGGNKNCYLTSESLVYNINQLEFVDFSIYDYTLMESDFVIITHPLLKNASEEYKNYRSSEAGGSLNANIYLIDQLYDQFSYGIKQNPLAIKNFIAYALSNWQDSIKNIFIIGNALPDDSVRCCKWSFGNSLVPSFGNPPSDNMLASGLDISNYVPLVQISRLAAKTETDVFNYLDKVKTYESQAQDEWMKNVIHLAGGFSYEEQKKLQGYIDNYEAIVSDTLWGANVLTFTKSTSNPIEELTTDRFYNRVDSGVALINFFGHSTGTIGFDVNIDDPDKYQNFNKYFFLIANGCFSGNIHYYKDVTSEDFVLADGKGAIGYISSSSLGITERLNDFTIEFLKNVSYKNYGSPVGEILKKTFQELFNNSLSEFTKSNIQQTTYHGDPYLKFPTAEKPDYTIATNDILFTPKKLTTDLSTFEINMIVKNKGMAVLDSFMVNITWAYPDGTSDKFFQQYNAPFYKDTLKLTLPMDPAKATGINSFTVIIDINNHVEEIDDFINNQASTSIFITSDDILPVYPYKFSIVDTNEITFMASTGNPFQSLNTFIFEIDSSNQFDVSSGAYDSIHVKSQGGVVKFKTNLPLNKDSTEYFWRVKKDTLFEGKEKWFESTFIYVKNGPQGWNKSNFSQIIMDNDYTFIKIDSLNKKFSFYPTSDEIYCITEGSDGPIERDNVEYFLNNARQSFLAYCHFNFGAEIKEIIAVVVFDRDSMKPWQNEPKYSYGTITCISGDIERWFAYDAADASARDSIGNLINNIVPDSSWVMVFSYHNNYAKFWTNSLIKAIESLGTKNLGIITAANDRPFIILGKKGSKAGSAIEVYPDTLSATPPSEQVLILDTVLFTDWTHGYTITKKIGPAKSWYKLIWDNQLNDISDSLFINIFGVDSSGMQYLLFNKIDSLTKSLTSIDAKQYPYLQLQVYYQDKTLRTPPDLKLLRVIYTPVPEFALSPSVYYQFHKDSIETGDRIKFSIGIENISEIEGDSLLIKYSLIDQNRNTINLLKQKNKKMQGNDTLISSIDFDSRSYSGNNTLVIDVNPDFDQPEQSRFNNIGLLSFYVKPDNTAPLLDVTFDNIHILDGDIVSPSPFITIKVSDDNNFIVIDDTASIDVYLKKPSEDFNRLNYSSGSIIFYPANLSKGNYAMVEYNPIFINDGIYELKVEAEDASANRSGKYSYVISFEVINKSTITNIINYPNPFSTSTRFVFVLTGSQLPSDLRIQIMTISGKMIREITKEELGTIRIGRNISDFEWDGTDEFGDPLANGIYLYRVFAKIDDAAIELRETDADKYIMEGFGKMYLLR